MQAKTTAFDRALVNAERRAQDTDRSRALDTRARETQKRQPDPVVANKRPEHSAAKTAAPEAAKRAEPQETTPPDNSVDDRRDSAPKKVADKPCDDVCAQPDAEKINSSDKDAAPVETATQTAQPATVAASPLNPELVAAQFAALLAKPNGEKSTAEAAANNAGEAQANTEQVGVAAAPIPVATLAATNAQALIVLTAKGTTAEPAQDKAATVSVSAVISPAASFSTSAGKATEETATLVKSTTAFSAEDQIKTTGKDALSKEPAQATRGAAHELASVVDQLKSTAPASPTAPAPALAAAEDAAKLAKPADPAKAMMQADAPVPLHAMAVEIGMRAMRGSKEFAIRLDPEDLGRVDIKLEISEAGQIKAKLVVDRVETLHLLQRDAKTLERAFEQAGLKTNPEGLQFSLRDPGQQNRNANREQNADRNTSGSKDNSTPAIEEIVLRPVTFRSAATSGLDIRI